MSAEMLPLSWNGRIPNSAEQTASQRQPQTDRQKAAKAIAAAKEVRKWIATPEGQEQLKNALRSATEMSRQISEAQRVDAETMNKPASSFNLRHEQWRYATFGWGEVPHDPDE